MAKLRKGNFILFSDGKIALVDKIFKQKQRRFIIVDEYLMSMVYYYKICYDYYPEKIYVDNKIITIISKKNAIIKIKEKRDDTIKEKEQEIKNIQSKIDYLKLIDHKKKLESLIKNS